MVSGLLFANKAAKQGNSERVKPLDIFNNEGKFPDISVSTETGYFSQGVRDLDDQNRYFKIR